MTLTAVDHVQLHLGVEEDFRPARTARPGLTVTGIEAYGTPVTWGGNLPGRRRFFAHDPVGNRLEFRE